MDFDKIIIDYYDRVASNEDQNELFKKMSTDSEIRSKFNKMGIINRAVNESLNSFTPASYVTSSIYNKLGYSVPPGLNIKESFFKRKKVLFGYIFSTLSAAALTIGIMLTFFPSTKQVINVPYPVVKFQNVDKPLTVLKSNGSNISHFVSRDNKLSHEVFSNSPVVELSEQTAGKDENKVGLRFASTVPIINNPRYDEMKNENYIDDNNSYDSPLLFKKHVPLGLTIGLNSSAVWNIPSATIPSNYVSPFSNICFSLYYNISNRLKFGAEVRQESYYLEYTGIESENIIYRYKEQTNFASYSVNARYYPIDKNYFNPFLGLNIGFNKGGIIVRPSVGIEYQVYSDIAFVLGIEGTRFWFTHQNNLFYTTKVGLNYGVLINF